MRNGNSKACSGVFPSPPAQTLHKRTWGLPRYLMTELHHVRPAGLLLHLSQRKWGAEGKGGQHEGHQDKGSLDCRLLQHQT